jgi:hypothetical protein
MTMHVVSKIALNAADDDASQGIAATPHPTALTVW